MSVDRKTPLASWTDTDASDHARDKATIARTLAERHRGRDTPISSAALAEQTACSASTVRDLVPQVMAEYGLPVGMAAGKGYFVIESEAEQARQVERQLEQAETSRKRARLISATWQRQNGGGA